MVRYLDAVDRLADRDGPAPRPARVLPLDPRGAAARIDPAEVDRQVMGQLVLANADLLARVLEGEGLSDRDPLLAALAAARNLGLVVDDVLRGLALQARRAGHTWAAIGGVLHVTRQAALQRFGTAAAAPDPPPAGRPVRGAGARGTRLVVRFLEGRFEEVRTPFDRRMRDACSAELLASVRERVAATAGELVARGGATVSVAHGHTVVDVPLAFERGQRTARVTFNAGGQVAGFFVLDASATSAR